MSADLPYHLTHGYANQGSIDASHPVNLAHSGAAQARYPSQMQLSQQQQQQQQYQRLKVEDALSYLDKVKLQFSNQPEVYNKFLDIMKEFKSQTIDTMGVINRVSELFDGHTELIVGFNTFLPPGYKIEMNSTSDSISVYHDGQRVPAAGPLRSAAVSHTLPAGLTSSSSSAYDARQPATRHTTDTQRGVMSAMSAAASDTQTTTQPVEFDHAIIYVNKIKSRYQSRPDIYKSFLEILHYYQKVQRDLKDGNAPSGPAMTETEVYDRVARLFQDQPDLLAEFGQFLPDAGGAAVSSRTAMGMESSRPGAHLGTGAGHSSTVKKFSGSYTSSKASSSAAVKTGHRRRLSATISTAPVHAKKMKADVPKDISLAEAGKYGSLTDFAFFDKIRKTLNSDRTYTDFLRCIKLYTMSVVSSSELLLMIQPFFIKAPELKKRLKDLVRQRDDSTETALTSHSKDRMTGEFAMDIDFASCKKYTESYRGVPSSYVPPRCSGRTDLCNEVLNDTIVSFPSWSEDSSSVIKKTMADEQIFRCEEDRYQLDIVLENIQATILCLDGVADKLSRMTPEDQAKFRLDNCLGGRSECLGRRTIMRLYKEHGAATIDALKRNPAVSVPLVLHRLQMKASELREARRSQQRTWNEVNQKYHLKSLDHQGLNFKQTDTKQLRSKALLAEIEAAFDERQENNESSQCNGSDAAAVAAGPLMTLTIRRVSVLEDAVSLIIHHVKRQSSIHSDDKRKIKRLLRQLLPTLFSMSPGELSDDEDDDDVDKDVDDTATAADVKKSSSSCDLQREERQSNINQQHKMMTTKQPDTTTTTAATTTDLTTTTTDLTTTTTTDLTTTTDVTTTTAVAATGAGSAAESSSAINTTTTDSASATMKTAAPSDNMDCDDAAASDDDDSYSVLFGNNNWYLLLRLYYILCDRLIYFQSHAEMAMKSACAEHKPDTVETAYALCLKTPRPVEPVNFYSCFLEMVRSYLDGNTETTVYEEQLRDIFGIYAYVGFTMDKLIQNIVRQLQQLVTDVTCVHLTDLYSSHVQLGVSLSSVQQSSAADMTYQRRAEQLLSDDNCFKLTLFKKDARLTIDLLETDSNAGSFDGQTDESQQKWSAYIDRFAASDDTTAADMCELAALISQQPVLLHRNVRRCMERNKEKTLTAELHQPETAAGAMDDEMMVDSDRPSTSYDSPSTTSDAPTAAAAALDGDAEQQTPAVRSAGAKSSAVGETASASSSADDGGVSLLDSVECKFNVNSCRMIFVINTESFLYRRNSLSTARQSHRAVSLARYKKFSSWLGRWCDEFASPDDVESCTRFLLGKDDRDLVASETERQLVPATDDTPPYHDYNRYHVTAQTD